MWQLVSTPAQQNPLSTVFMCGNWYAHPLKRTLSALFLFVAIGKHTRPREPAQRCIYVWQLVSTPAQENPLSTVSKTKSPISRNIHVATYKASNQIGQFANLKHGVHQNTGTPPFTRQCSGVQCKNPCCIVTSSAMDLADIGLCLVEEQELSDEWAEGAAEHGALAPEG